MGAQAVFKRGYCTKTLEQFSMGAGASSGIQAAVKEATADEVKEAIAGLPADQLKKLQTALDDVSKPELYSKSWKFETEEEMQKFFKDPDNAELPDWFKD